MLINSVSTVYFHSPDQGFLPWIFTQKHCAVLWSPCWGSFTLPGNMTVLHCPFPTQETGWGVSTAAWVHLGIYQAVCECCIPLLSGTTGFGVVQHSGGRCDHCWEEALDILQSNTDVCNSNFKCFRFHGKKWRDIVEGSEIHGSPSPQVSLLSSYFAASALLPAPKNEVLLLIHVEIDSLLLFLQLRLPHSTFLTPL